MPDWHQVHADGTLKVVRPATASHAQQLPVKRRAHFNYVDYQMALRFEIAPDGSRKQHRRYRGRFVSEGSCQTDSHLSVSLLAELTLRSAMNELVTPVAAGHGAAALSDEALHAMLACARYMQLHGLAAEPIVADAVDALEEAGYTDEIITVAPASASDTSHVVAVGDACHGGSGENTQIGAVSVVTGSRADGIAIAPADSPQTCEEAVESPRPQSCGGQAALSTDIDVETAPPAATARTRQDGAAGDEVAVQEASTPEGKVQATQVEAGDEEGTHACSSCTEAELAEFSERFSRLQELDLASFASADDVTRGPATSQAGQPEEQGKGGWKETYAAAQALLLNGVWHEKVRPIDLARPAPAVSCGSL